tara:strand:- start:101 stop:322 length:222 start_codon:yes stop_codon:yes gene_type:complete
MKSYLINFIGTMSLFKLFAYQYFTHKLSAYLRQINDKNLQKLLLITGFLKTFDALFADKRGCLFMGVEVLVGF